MVNIRKIFNLKRIFRKFIQKLNLPHQKPDSDPTPTNAITAAPVNDSTTQVENISPGNIMEAISPYNLPLGCITLPSAANDCNGASTPPAESVPGPQENTVVVSPEETNATSAKSPVAPRSSPSKTSWEKAIEKLRKKYPNEFDVEDSDQREIITKVLNIIKDRQKDCEEKRWKFRKPNGEEVVLREVAGGIITSLNKLVPIGNAIFQHGPLHASVLWTTFQFILQAASNDMETMQNILPEIGYISSILERCATYETLYKESPLKSAQQFKDSLPDLYAAILEYLLSSKRYFSANTAIRYAYGSVNPYSEEFLPLLERIKELERTTENAAGATLHEFINNWTIKLEKTNSDSERSKILTWLSKIHFKEHHLRIRQLRQANTGDWLLKKNEFMNWKNSLSSSTLWLHGIAGAGKTMLASFVIDAITQTRSIDDAVAYFYCSHQEKERQDPVLILRAIVKQLCTMNSEDSLPTSVISKYRKHKNEGFTYSGLQLSECQELISSFTEGFQQTVIILDALDECDKDSRRQLLEALDKILKSSPGLLKIFISSRDADDIALELKSRPNVYINSKDNANDIEVFVQAEVERCIAKRHLLRGNVDPELKDAIIGKLTKGANGMFLWVSLQIKTICDKKTSETVKTALDHLPKGLEETYSVIWGKITEKGEDEENLVRRTLMLIMCAARPLTPNQIIRLATTDPTGKRDNRYGSLTDTDLLDLCQNFVVIDKQLGVLRTAHFSVDEFLARHITISEAQTLAAEICLTLMCDVKFYETVEGTDHPLLDYVLRNWAHHIRSSGKGASSLLPLQKKFLRPSPAYSAWIKVFLWPPKFDSSIKTALSKMMKPHHTETQLDPLWVAFYYQLWDFCRDLMSSNVNWHVRNIHGIMPLHLAAFHGNKDFVDFLIERQGVDLNAKDEYGRTALWYASNSGQAAVVKLLLEKENVELDSKDKLSKIGAFCPRHERLPEGEDLRLPEGQGGKTALFIAAFQGHEEVVQMLLQRKDIDLNSEDGYRRTPLFAASSKGNHAVVGLLLTKDGINLNAKDIDGKTPLLAAASMSEDSGLKVVKMLLSADGVDSNCKDHSGRTLAWYAASSGNATVISGLLSKDGIDWNAKDNYGKTPLFTASEAGKHAVIELLLTKDEIDVNAKDKDGRTPLLGAASVEDDGGVKAVEMLLAKEGVDLNAKDNGGKTPLSAAAWEENHAVVRLLLTKSGIDLNAKDDYGRTPLLTAASIGSGGSKMVDMLLSADGVDWNCKDYSGRTLPWYAARNGNVTVIKNCLLKDGVDCNIKDNEGKTPLLAATLGGVEVVEMLLAKDGIDMNAKDNEGKTLLLEAASNGHHEVVELLLTKKGIDMNAKDNEGKTPLLAAASIALVRGWKAVQLLLSADGVDWSCKDNFGRTLGWYAADDGNTTVIKSLLSKDGIDWNAKDIDGKTPLSVAASAWDDKGVKVVEMLLAKDGIDFNAKDNDGITPLLGAAGYGNSAVVELLLSTDGVDSNPKDHFGRTLLWHATRSGNEALVKSCLSKDAIDLNAKDNDGKTPLLVAAEGRHHAVVELLLSTDGVDSSCKDNSGRTILWHAARGGNVAVIRSWLSKDGIDWNAKDSDGKSLLLLAAEEGECTVVELLLTKDGIDLNAKDNNGRTPLFAAAAASKLGWRYRDSRPKDALFVVVDMLLAKDGIDVNAKDNYGKTPLLAAAEKGNDRVLRLLLAKDGIDLNAKDNVGKTPLLAAAEKGNHAIVELLLSTDGVDSSCKDNSGWTLLWHAARGGNEAVIRSWLSKDGIDLNAKDSDGKTLLLAAAEGGSHELVELLLSTDGVDSSCSDNFGRTLHWYAARSGVVAVIRSWLSEDGIDLNAKDSDGKTILMAAAEAGKYDVVSLLLAKGGIDLNAKDKDGKTPLFAAASSWKYCHFKIVSTLLAKDGIDLNAKDNDGKTPLFAAAEKGNDRVVRLLLAKNSIDLNAKDKVGKTPLFAAAENGKCEVVWRLFAENGVDVYSKDDNGKTPLNIATEKGHHRIVNLLRTAKSSHVECKDVGASAGRDDNTAHLLEQ